MKMNLGIKAEKSSRVDKLDKGFETWWTKVQDAFGSPIDYEHPMVEAHNPIECFNDAMSPKDFVAKLNRRSNSSTH